MRINKIIRLCGFLSLLSAAACTRDGADEEMRRSCLGFTQEFYDWYVPYALKENGRPASSLALERRGSVFSRELLRSLGEDAEERKSSPGEITGLDFDPFLNSQDPAQSYVAGKLTLKDGVCRVEMYGVFSGKRSPGPEVTPELVLKDGKWVFVDFHYGHSGSKRENLSGVLKSLAAGRKERRK